MAESRRFTFRVSERIDSLVTKAAQEQTRSRSRQVAHYVRQGLVKDGLIPGWPDDPKDGGAS